MGESKRRDCPVLGRTIERAECAQWRHASVACTADCPHNTFNPAQYHLLREMEDRLIGASLRRLLDTGSGPAADAFRKAAERLDEPQMQIHGLRAQLVERDAAGLTLTERWLADPRVKWKTDERTFLQGMLQIQPGFFEVLRVIDGVCVEVREHISGVARMIIADGLLAARACRFDCFLGWHFPMPHFHRIGGLVHPFDPVGPLSAWEVFLELLRHHGASLDAIRQDPHWLLEHGLELNATMTRLLKERRRRMISGPETLYWYGSYMDAGPDAGLALVDLFDDMPQLMRLEPGEDDDREPWETDRWIWFARRTDGAPSQLGNVRFNEDTGRWGIDALCASHYAVLKAAFEKVTAGQVRFLSERFEDLAANVLQGVQIDVSQLPQSLLEHCGSDQPLDFKVQSLEPGTDERNAAMRARFQVWTQQALPALGGRTPVEAAADPAMAGTLLTLVKRQINAADRRNLEDGLSFDLAPLVRAAGLPDPGEPPPPLRPKSDTLFPFDENHPLPLLPHVDLTLEDAFADDEQFLDLQEDDEDEDPDDGNNLEINFPVLREAIGIVSMREPEAGFHQDGIDLDSEWRTRPHTPHVKRQLSVKHVRTVGKPRMDQTADFTNVLREIALCSGSEFLPAVRALRDETGLPDATFGAFIVSLGIVFFNLVEEGHRIDRISFEQLRWAYLRIEREAGPRLENPTIDVAIGELSPGCPQPYVLFAAGHNFSQLFAEQDLDSNALAPDQVRAIMLLRACIDLVSNQLRSPQAGQP